MKGRNRRLQTLETAVFAWLLAGLTLWLLVAPVSIASFVVDEPLRIDEGSDPPALLEGTTTYCSPLVTTREIGDAPLPGSVRLPPHLAAEGSPAGSIFRLRLVRSHPPIGPP